MGVGMKKVVVAVTVVLLLAFAAFAMNGLPPGFYMDGLITFTPNRG